MTYAYWPDGVVFRKGEPVTMQSDISAIIEDARDYEDQYGEDRGHGWLLNHPLRKLLFYQHYLDTKARLAPAAKAPAATTPTKRRRLTNDPDAPDEASSFAQSFSMTGSFATMDGGSGLTVLTTSQSLFKFSR